MSPLGWPVTGTMSFLIDADKQGSASAWASLREHTDFKVISLARENMARDALKLAADHTYTVIDGIVASDLVLVPIEPCLRSHRTPLLLSLSQWTERKRWR